MSENEVRDLTEPGGKIRLYVEAALDQQTQVDLSPQQSHYLLHVMRARAGDRVGVFNGRDGEWLAEIVATSKRGCTLSCSRRVADQTDVPDIWLVFAPIKKIAADYAAQKATELGVRVLQPIFTHRTIVHRVNAERMRANAIEAAEQSGRATVPEVRAAVDLDKLLRAWPAERRILFCDETGGTPIARALGESGEGPWAILTGPEGGFDAAERDLIRSNSSTIAVSLGKRILRADTAALAALSVWQAVNGDWR